jgi:hypothetical protein
MGTPARTSAFLAAHELPSLRGSQRNRRLFARPCAARAALSDPVSHCPCRGTAEHWSVCARDGLHQDLAWSYRAPLPETQKIADLIAFYDETVDTYVDGARQERPTPRFS